MPHPSPEAASVKYLTDKAGIYIHIPFCAKKCAYCSFYSAAFTDVVCDAYMNTLKSEIRKWGGLTDHPIDTIYIGGGTPSLIGPKRLEVLLSTLKESFSMDTDAEITVEVNPDSCTREFLNSAVACGVNRLSVGVQSGSDEMLSRLGRRHTLRDAQMTFEYARTAGFKNISADIMIALPESTEKTLLADIDAVCGLAPEHISAYILKIEPKTAFYKGVSGLPDDDAAAQQYLTLCDELSSRGYGQYEISNFARTGFESRHNLKYWHCEEYIGIGPAAHSFYGGKRFYYPSDLKGFIASPQVISDGVGGQTEERLMLALRLVSGVELSEYGTVGAELLSFIERLSSAGLVTSRGSHISLTPQGMAVSNSIITEITELLYENI